MFIIDIEKKLEFPNIFNEKSMKRHVILGRSRAKLDENCLTTRKTHATLSERTSRPQTENVSLVYEHLPIIFRSWEDFASILR